MILTVGDDNLLNLPYRKFKIL